MENKIMDIADVMDPSNLLVVIANVLAFVVLETAFFYFIASKSVDEVLRDKAEFIAFFVTRKQITEYDMRAYLDDEYNTVILPKIAKEQKKLREKSNIELIKSYIAPVVIACGVLIFLLIVRMMFKRQPLTYIDKILLFSVLGAFTTELYFYITVTSQLIYIGDDEIVYDVYTAVQDAIQGKELKLNY